MEALRFHQKAIHRKLEIILPANLANQEVDIFVYPPDNQQIIKSQEQKKEEILKARIFLRSGKGKGFDFNEEEMYQ